MFVIQNLKNCLQYPLADCVDRLVLLIALGMLQSSCIFRK